MAPHLPKDFLTNPYGYTPTKALCIVFGLLFLISFIAHTVQAFKHRMRWLLFSASLCALMEFIGWGCRLWSSFKMQNRTPFKIQLVMTVIAPTPLLATNFIVLGRIISLLGTQYSRISPRWYFRIFLSCDIIALVTQTIGGIVAVTATDPTNGGHIMLAGISFQFAAITIFCLVCLEYYWRWATWRPHRTAEPAEGGNMTRGLLWVSYALAFSTLFIYIRATYRLVELVDGFAGHIARTEWYFCVFEAPPIILALYAWNIVHPGRLPKEMDRRSKEEHLKMESNSA
ncbi:RTA1 like protein-domain-containing protein [Flagelloscypha sp. PMI_526]|nr:RTA1 like protein-domain-containing protein [Flagelloscypha sp. PMI_526]